MIKPDYSQAIPSQLGTVHFVGIGGSGMSGLAKLLLDAGHRVTGSDVRPSGNIDRLRAAGAEIAIGHAAENIGEADTVVVTSALWPHNPELLRAKELGLPVLHRSALLAHLASRGRLIAVAGAHGKTTSTGMIITALHHLEANPSFVNGGVIFEFGDSAAFGSGEFFVIEADESDSSFLHYKTAVTLITNVDPDHLDHFGSLEAFEQEFVRFADAASDLVVISSDDAGAKRVTAQLKHSNVITFGTDPSATVRVVEVSLGAGVACVLEYQGAREPMQLTIPGQHNAINAAGAVAVLVGLGFGFAAAVAQVARFAGTQRRFELHGKVREVSVYDDFAHHPTEVAAALRAARETVGEGRLITVFQPHLYSRTRIFAQEFAEALALSDLVVITDVYAAREDPEPGVTGATITERFANEGQVHYVPEWSDVAKAAADLAGPGDFIITMGCGDIYRMVPELLQALER